MKRLKPLILIFISLILTSCSSYISQMHREFDRADGEPPAERRDKFALYRNKMQRKRMKPLVNSETNPYVVPSVKRKYQSENKGRKRYKANDLADNKGDGSLWSGVEGRNNFLFTNNEKKNPGDIVLIQVAGHLKNEITAELKRAFPTPNNLNKKKDKKADEGKAPASAAAEQSGGDDQQVDTDDDKVYDRISSVVVEEINHDHILLRGRKNVLYKNRKRVVEVQALIARRDVTTEDTVHSDKIIESQVQVVR